MNTATTTALRHELTRAQLPDLYATEETPAEEKIIKARLFALGSAATWLIAEMDPESGLMFGYADLRGDGPDGGAEWGYASLDELEALTFCGIPRVELDAHFTPKPFAQCVDKQGKIL